MTWLRGIVKEMNDLRNVVKDDVTVGNYEENSLMKKNPGA
jgi:hypothetical protein